MDMNSQAFDVLKMENQNNDEFDWLYSEEEYPPSPFGTWQQDSRLSNGGLLNFEFDPFQLPNDIQNNHFPYFGLEEICQDLGLYDLKLLPPSFQEDNNTLIDDANAIANVMPLNMTHDLLGESQQVTNSAFYEINGGSMEFIKKWNNNNNNGRHKKSDTLELEEIQRYFHVPITKAAKELRVGLTVLKKRCRELNIMRWPHRKLKSLQTLIHSVKEMGLTSEVEMLEEHQRMVEKVPEMELTERTKKLRQACFKANYKKRRASMVAAFY
ncbi:protein RKD4 [Solanum dulcamara]|uniref:protein RKD4 n=1 Tax=Solanum dulcamara TaxID=45834 RepID=UPI002484DC1E|nr:protein RKD4 [Solanum dulcamara]